MDLALAMDGEAGLPEDAPRALPPSHRIEIWAREDGRQVRFVSDATTVADAELIDVLTFDTQEHADAVARRCAEILGASESMRADAEGWHMLPDGSTDAVLKNLLLKAKERIWSDLEPDEACLAPLPIDVPIAAVLVRASPPAEEQSCTIIPLLPEKPRRTRAARTWTRERDRALVELILTGSTAKEAAIDPRMAGVSVDAIYQRASEIGMSFRASAQVTIRGLPASVLAVYDRAAAACHKSRDGLVRDWMMKAASDPARYGLTVL